MSNNNWTLIWNRIIFPILESIYDAMNSLAIYFNGYRISLWSFCLAIIVFGSIMNLFINFTTPTLPDRSSTKRKKGDND